MKELNKWINGCKVRAFPWIDHERIYFNVQYYASGQSVNKPPIWDKTVYITDNENGRYIVFELTASLVEHVAKMSIVEGTEVTITA